MTRPAVAASPASRALGVVGPIALLALTLAHPSTSRMFTWPWTLLAVALWLAPVALLVARLATRSLWRWPDRWALAGVAVLAFGAVASAGASPFAAASLARTWPTLAGAALFLLLHDWLAGETTAACPRSARVAQIVTIGSALVVVVSGAWWAIAAPASHRWLWRNAIPFGHSNYTAGFVVLATPWFMSSAWTTRGAARFASAAALPIGFLVLATTSSRGGVVALVVSAAVFLTVALVRTHWTRRKKILVASAVVALGAIATLANPRLRDLVVRREWSDAARESNAQRSAMLAAGARLGLARPLLGWGPGTVPLAYPRVRAQLDGGVDDVLELHNTPVQLWATLGAPGLIAFALFAVASARALTAVARAPVQPATIAATASLGGYALFALTDHQLDVPLITAIVAADFAVVCSAIARPARAARARTGVLAFALAIAPLVALSRDLQARLVYEHGLAALERGHRSDFVAALDRATRVTPSDPFFDHQAANALLAARDAATDPQRRAELTRQAIARLERSLATGAHEEFAHFNLGWLELERSNAAAAARHFVAAARLVPDKGGVYFGLGLALEALGRRADAIRAFALEWINDPRSATSPAWETPALAPLAGDVRAEVKKLYPPLRALDPRAATAEAWARLWWGEAIEARALGRGFSASAAAFAASALVDPPAKPRAPVFDWERLLAAWHEGDLRRVAPNDPTLAAALARRATRHGHSFLSFLTAGTEDEPALVRTFRRQRTGYGVLASHPEGPLLTDMFTVQENRVAGDFAADLFPPKGWLPGRFLLALLPANP